MPKKAVRRPRILLVEDSHGDARLLSEAFQETPVHPEIVHALDAQKGWEEVQRLLEGPPSARPNLMVLDLGLPGQSGLELLARVRRDAAAADWPIIILTSSLGDEDIREARSHKAAGYFAKPLTVDGYVQLAQVLNERWLLAAK